MDWYGPDKATFGTGWWLQGKIKFITAGFGEAPRSEKFNIKSWENDNSSQCKSALHAGWFVECIDYVVN